MKNIVISSQNVFSRKIVTNALISLCNIVISASRESIYQIRNMACATDWCWFGDRSGNSDGVNPQLHIYSEGYTEAQTYNYGNGGTSCLDVPYFYMNIAIC